MGTTKEINNWGMAETKDIPKPLPNQAIKADKGKPRISIVPQQILYDIAEVREYGDKKYGSTDNWKQVELQRYIDALYRHLIEFVRDNNSKDEESGIEHHKHMACNMSFICEMLKGGEQNG